MREGSGSAFADLSAAPARVALACLTATLAFWAYTATLLPGIDLGDTGGFQAAVLWPETSARRGYPLYYALAAPFVQAVSVANPARGLNLFSAIWAAAAVGLVTWLAARVTRSAVGAAAAGLLLAFSYTFWTQAVIAEVYSLHLALVAACLLLLEAFASKPGTARLTAFFALYAAAFANHLSMILLLVPFAVFLLQAHPRPRELVRPRHAAIAAACAAGGALLYLGNFLSVWRSIDAPAGWGDRVAAFWFDTTKADWRESMIVGVSREEIWPRLAMWAWDARQQFGLVGIAFAIVGFFRSWSVSRRWALLLTLGYGINTLFALTYNVGDPHVFFLPGHLFTALAAAFAVAPPRTFSFGATSTRLRSWFVAPRRPAAAAAALLLAYASWRGWETWPAADRSADVRAEALVARVAQGVEGMDSILVSSMDWQSENALLYSGRYERPGLLWTRLSDVLFHFPFLVRDNHRIGRDVVLTAEAASEVVAAYGTAFDIVEDLRFGPVSLLDQLERLPRGTPYILSLLTPPRDERFDPAVFDEVLRTLTTPGETWTDVAYQVWAGRVGEPPSRRFATDRPFSARVDLFDERFQVRMDAWLPFDTFRRGGFGHVIRGRDPILTIERGASLAWFRPDGTVATAYLGGLYAPEARFRIPAGATLELAALPN